MDRFDPSVNLSELLFPIFPVLVTPPREPGGKWDKRPLRKWRDPFHRKPGPAWGNDWPANANGIGYVPADQGLIVIDLDTGHDTAWAEANLPPTRTHQTPSGEFHLLYECDEALSNSSGALPGHIDVRSATGLALWPGSLGYTLFDDGPIMPLPEAIRSMLRATSRADAPTSDQYADEDVEPWLSGARDWLAAQSETVDGWPIAAALVRNFGLTDEKARELWEEWQADFADQWDYEAISERLASARAPSSTKRGEGVAHDTWLDTLAADREFPRIWHALAARDPSLMLPEDVVGHEVIQGWDDLLEQEGPVQGEPILAGSAEGKAILDQLIAKCGGVAPGGLEKATFKSWRTRVVPPRVSLIGGLLSTTSRMMLIAPTGLGKTQFGLTLAGHSALGRDFLHWRMERPARWLYLDGEMSEDLMQQRVNNLARYLGLTDADERTLQGNLFLINRENFPDMPALDTPAGQQFIDAAIAGLGPLDGIIFDNLQSLTIGNMRETDAWSKIIPWIRELTARRIGQIWIHHANEQGQNYGDKSKEWQLDTVVVLKKLEDPGASDVAFDLAFSKHRERTPANRADYRPGRMTFQGGIWRFSAAAGGSAAAEIYETLTRLGIRGLPSSLSTAELAEAILGPAPDDANGIVEWKVELGHKAEAIRKAIQRDRKNDGPLSRLGGEGPSGRKAGKPEWRWFLPPIIG